MPRALCLSLLILMLPGFAPGQAPAKVGYQGRLLNADGSPATGQQQIAFAIYDQASGGNQLWSETQQLAPIDGYYATFLGEVSSFPADLFSGAERYLQLSVGGTALVPRQRIGSVPFALNCTNLSGGTVNAASLTVSGHSVVDTSGKVDYAQLKSCGNAGDLLSWSGSAWTCQAGNALSAVSVAAPLTGNGTSGSALSMPAASGSADGYLSSANFTAFSGKLDKAAVSGPITGDGTAAKPLAIAAATASANGYLSSADYKAFAAKADPLTSGRLIEAEAMAAANVATGSNQADATASGGSVRFGAGSAATGGRLWGLHSSDLGALFGTGYTRATFRLKVTNNGSSTGLAVLSCSAMRPGTTSWAPLGVKGIKPSDFQAGLTWAYVTLYCDFRPDDLGQFVGIDNFATGVTDLSLDYVQLTPTVPCNVEMAPYGEVRCIDRVARAESAYGSSLNTCADEGKHVCSYSEVYTAVRAGAITETGASLRYSDLMYFPSNQTAYFAGGGGANGLNAPSGSALSSQPGPSAGTISFRCCR